MRPVKTTCICRRAKCTAMSRTRHSGRINMLHRSTLQTLQQFNLPPAVQFYISHLHTPEAADDLRQPGELCCRAISRLCNPHQILRPNASYSRMSSHSRRCSRQVAENIQRGAAKPAQACQHPEHRKDPAPEFPFLYPPGHRVRPGQERRREMDLEPVVTFKLPPELRLIPPVGIKPGHLVFVLAGHQLERVPCHRLGQFQIRPAVTGAGPLDPIPVAPCMGLVLTGGQTGFPPSDPLLECFWCREGCGSGELRGGEGFDHSRVLCARARPLRNARGPLSTATPLRPMAAPIASAPSGSAPRWPEG